MNKRKQNRPKWAKNLRQRDWDHLEECQGKKPTLRNLRRDVDHQNSLGVTCWGCRSALGKVSAWPL